MPCSAVAWTDNQPPFGETSERRSETPQLKGRVWSLTVGEQRLTSDLGTLLVRSDHF